MQEQKKESPVLTKKMAERVIKKNIDFFKSKGLTPKGSVLGCKNPAIIGAILSEKRGK